eukprot:TRINITY_DN35693_c0_g1_i1.p1 TRINITY_DN35693_c0_g1~~TRINITY_DN35693_c0_g1_i1.p1  ORF type:complete len:596 (+),score=227.94 TRINITY_DN35693_c0_g1_i1:59-1789(+)
MPGFLLMPPIAATDEFACSSDKDVSDYARDPELVADFTEAVARWSSLLAEVTEGHSRLLEDFASGHSGEVGSEVSGTPEAEIDLWVTAESRLGVHLQLSTQPVRLILRVIDQSDSEAAHKQKMLLLEAAAVLEKNWNATSDAVRYLSSLRPYIECLQEVAKGRSLSDAVDTLPPLFGALRMVWTCSSTYGADGGAQAAERFHGMLQRLCGLVTDGVCHHLRKLPPLLGRDMVVQTAVPTPGEMSRAHREQKDLVLHAADVCTTLKEQYYKVKLMLEEARAPPWDFPQEDDLFDHADFCYERTTELLGVLDAISVRHLRYRELKKQGHRQAPLINASLEDARQVFVGISFDWLCSTQLVRWRLVLDTFEQQMRAIDALADSEDTGTRRQPLRDLYKSLAKPPEPESTPFDRSNRPISTPSPMIVLNLAFNPPEIAILGPIRDGTVEALSDALPRAFTTTTSKTLFGKAQVPKFFRRKVGDESLTADPAAASGTELARAGDMNADGEYWHLIADSHFCSDQTGQSHVMLVLFDALEREGSWRLRDTHGAYLPLSGGGYRAYHKFFFSRRKAPPAERRV